MIKRSSQHNNNNNEDTLTDEQTGLMDEEGSMYLQDETMVNVVKANEQMKTMSIPENDGQAMVDNSFMHAKRTWKPMGRK